MNASALPVPFEEQEEAHGAKEKWRLKSLQPWHRQVCSLLAQGIPRQTIAQIMDCTPEYVSMLAAQPLIKDYIREWCAFAGLQLEAQFVKSVEVIGDALENGNYKEKLQAVEMQAKLTHRIGTGSTLPSESVDMNSRLLSLSERLTGLLESQKMAHDAKVEVLTYEHETSEDVSDADYQPRPQTEVGTRQHPHESAQEHGAIEGDGEDSD
jgi:hypothetical protein